MRNLNRLKAWLYHKRTTVRLDGNELSGGRRKRRRQPGERQSNQHYLTFSEEKEVSWLSISGSVTMVVVI